MERMILGDIEKCYSCMGKVIDLEPYLFFAGEGNGSLQAFHGPRFAEKTVIWEGGGGTMSLASIPGCSHTILASRGFYSMDNAQTSVIEMIHFGEGTFSHKPIAALPWLHRFDVVCGADKTPYIVAATLAESKASREDWSKPGHVYWAEITDEYPLQMHELPGSYYQNHGFFRACNTVYTSAREGAFRFTPPAQKGMAWKVEQLLDFPISDLAVCDIDQDGTDEVACIMPFHGNQYKVYKNGKEIYSYPVENDFYHAVYSACIDGKPVFIGGARKINASLFMLFWERELQPLELDRSCGPSNVSVLNLLDSDILLVACRQVGQAAIYIFPRSQCTATGSHE